MRVVNLALQKSGTKSFHHFCKSKNLRSLHWLPETRDGQYQQSYLEEMEQAAYQDLEAGSTRSLESFYMQNYFDAYQAFSDTPLAIVYHRFFEQDPNAIYLLIYRHPENWLDSVRRHFAKIDTYTDRLVYRRLTGIQRQRVIDYTDEELLDAYENYLQQVVRDARYHDIHLHLLSLEQNDLTRQLNRIIPVGQPGYFGQYR